MTLLARAKAHCEKLLTEKGCTGPFVWKDMFGVEGNPRCFLQHWEASAREDGHWSVGRVGVLKGFYDWGIIEDEATG